MSVARWGALLGLLCACGRGSPERNLDAPATEWHYQLSLDADLTRVEAQVCFPGPVPRELRAGRDEAAGKLSYARWLSPGPVRRLAVQSGRIQVEGSAQGGCVGYGVSLVEGGSMDAAVRRVGRDLLASPNVWLWRPERRAPDARATLRVTLPEGTRAQLPWPQRDGAYQLNAEAFRFDSYAAFGRFTPLASSEDGVAIEAAVLDGGLALPDEALLRWLRASVRIASLSDGRFPRDRLVAILVPSGVGPDPVLFGMVARGGAASVLLMVSGDASEPALLRDWVLPHELSHLYLPFVDREHAWLSEGLATYYQQILLARSGALSEREAIGELARGLRSASRENWSEEPDEPDTSLVRESARMRATQNYRKVYWGGAAFWLDADVALRQRTHGHASADTVLSALRKGEAEREVWTMEALIARLDALAGEPVFSEGLAVARRQAFPPFEETLSALGVRASGLDDAAPLAEIRRALFGRVQN